MRPHLRAVSRPMEKSREKILEAISVSKIFHVNGRFLTVLEEISFNARSGELICILGRSGCGKSTLLKILAGFITPVSGKVLLRGNPIEGPGPDRCVIFQEDALFPWLTVEENIAFGLRGRKGTQKSMAAEVERFLDLVGLRPFRGFLPREISGGMKQRVALARVLVLKPEVLLMDEPFASLDAQSREEMQDLLLSLWKELGHTILFVTHDVHEAVILADRVLLMGKDPGRIKEDFTIALKRPRSDVGTDVLQISRKLHEALRDQEPV